MRKEAEQISLGSVKHNPRIAGPNKNQQAEINNSSSKETKGIGVVKALASSLLYLGNTGTFGVY